jgi:IS5 family transposase
MYKTLLASMKHKGTPGLFDDQLRLEDLAKLGNPLFKLNQCIDWAPFRQKLEEWSRKPGKSKAGRPPYDKLIMFKTLIIQSIYILSDDAVEFQIKDRLTFQQFLGLKLCDRVPDAKTIWAFRETLKSTDNKSPDRVQELFELFYEKLKQKGLILNEGKMVDASIVSAPRPRNSKDEHDTIKNGKTPKEWEDQVNKLNQKDLDACFTKKHNKSYYGYKDHIKADTVSKLIDAYVVSPADMHDSQALNDLLTKKDKGQEIYADSAYTGETCEKNIVEAGMINQVHEKGCKNNPLTDEQMKNNKVKSKTRARVEHIFGMMTKRSQHSMRLFTKGLERARVKIGMMNLSYILNRATYLSKAYGINLPI